MIIFRFITRYHILRLDLRKLLEKKNDVFSKQLEKIYCQETFTVYTPKLHSTPSVRKCVGTYLYIFIFPLTYLRNTIYSTWIYFIFIDEWFDHFTLNPAKTQTLKSSNLIVLVVFIYCHITFFGTHIHSAGYVMRMNRLIEYKLTQVVTLKCPITERFYFARKLYFYLFPALVDDNNFIITVFVIIFVSVSFSRSIIMN